MDEKQILFLQRDAVAFIQALAPSARIGSATTARSIADFDQMESASTETDSDAQASKIWQRWPGSQQGLAGAAIGLLLTSLDELLGGPDRTDHALAKTAKELSAKTTPFEEP